MQYLSICVLTLKPFDMCIYIHYLLIQLNLAFIYSLCNSKLIMSINEYFPLLWLDGEACFCVMGQDGGSKKALIITLRQAKLSREMEEVIVAGV
jgi:hypothetical protein